MTTIAAVLAMAAHVDGVNASTLDMTGLAQKGGPVTSHIRFAARDTAIEGPRVPTAALDVLLASDMVVSCGAEALALMNGERTRAFANGTVAPTAEFAIRQTQSIDEAQMVRTLEQAARDLQVRDVAGIAETLFGDTLYSNMMLVGMAFQAGSLPLSLSAIEAAIHLNGVAIDANLKALAAGRILVANPKALLDVLPGRTTVQPMELDERIAFLADELTRYHDAKYAARYRDLVERVREADSARGVGGMRLTRTVVENLYRLMAVKDEYEVARLYSEPEFREKLLATFADPKTLKVMLAPPLLSRTDPATGRPKKRAFGPWIFSAFALLAASRRLRGTVFDPFGYTAERKAERALLARYMDDLALILNQLEEGNYGLLVELARVPDMIRGFGPVKEASMVRAHEKRAQLLGRFNAGGPATNLDDDSDGHFREAAE
ncbi:DUF6537 domain-containing protein [Breoghania sp. L-A4]|uniref:DUF6537 domain-containing protein n=1 Tax=Breoghania sp. L-A4 TaxID=2304600 RepID=UPI003204B185